MLNQAIIVGRVYEIIEEENNSYIKLKVSRNYKNDKGEYDEDIFSCKTFNNFNQELLLDIRNNDIVGIKGHLESIDDKVVIVMEKITILSSKAK